LASSLYDTHTKIHWPLPCMIRIHNSLASSLYDTYPEFTGLFSVW
jgi:hypothetical protein